ncbi:hypothetical protein GRX01_09565 [Halobaculum sp. WSA2]|uniref:Uncharacterized protein n=1 Tax=Halobaculum saliterrae TaxID=2073113 RepID=A0A6B0SRN8_9EURY|nr:hypothetical protein [Halobaculum saliterrae]MXR41584.1 hypothetical protein [Halobaculum saliterrae]
MSWHGVDAVDDAIDVTREFLLPFSLGRWIRMVVVSLFTGGGGAGGQVASNAGNFGARLAGAGGFSGPSGGASALATLSIAVPTVAAGALALAPPVIQAEGVPEPGALGALGIAALVLAVAIALLAVLLSPVFEFVLVDAIARDDLRLLRDVGNHLTNGLRLLGFRIGLFAAFVVPPAAVVGAAVLSGVRVDTLADRPLVLVGVALVAIGYLLVYAFVDRFTVEFVVPAMVADGGGVIDGWRRVWPRLRTQPGQTIVYLVMHVLVGIGLSIVSFVLLLVGLLVVGAVAAGVGFAVGTVSSGAATTDLGIGLGLLAGVVVGVPLFVVLVVLPVRVVTVTYRRSYEIAALGRFGGNMDLIGRYRDGDGDGGDDVAAAFGDDGDDGGEDPAPDADGDRDGGGVGASTDEEFGEFVPASSEMSDRPDDRHGSGESDDSNVAGDDSGDDDAVGDDDTGDGDDAVDTDRTGDGDDVDSHGRK